MPICLHIVCGGFCTKTTEVSSVQAYIDMQSQYLLPSPLSFPISELGHKKHCSFLLALNLLRINPAALSRGHSHGPDERPTWQGTEASCKQLCKWTLLEVVPQAPAKLSLVNSLTAASWETLSRNHPPSCSQISDLQKLCEIRNVCSFKLLNFGANCFAEI